MVRVETFLWQQVPALVRMHQVDRCPLLVALALALGVESLWQQAVVALVLAGRCGSLAEAAHLPAAAL